MNQPLFVEMKRDPWVMEPRALEAFLMDIERLQAASPAEFLARSRAAADGSSIPQGSRMKVSGSIAEIPVTGILVKRDAEFLRFFGIEATNYSEIAADIEAAIANSDVQSIVLKVESPGGQVAGVEVATEAIYQARQKKPIRAQIQDIGASGAYYLASQASTISANAGALVGSIGVYLAYVDSSKYAADLGFKVHLIKSGEHKGMGVFGTEITKDQLGAMQEIVDGMAAQFVQAVVRGRGKDPKTVQGWATGRVWLAAEAKALGLIDDLEKVNAAAPSGSGMAVKVEKEGEKTMADEQKDKQAQAQAVDAAREDARKEERARVASIKAAFPEDPAFALSQIESGASLAEAKMARFDALQKSNEALRAENDSLKKAGSQGKPGKGASAVSFGGNEGGAAAVAASNGEDVQSALRDHPFMVASREYSETNEIPLTRAKSHVARTQPSVFQSYQEACKEMGPQYTANKKHLGVT